MRIFLSNKKNTDERMIHCSHIISLDQTVLDGEAKEIIVDNFMSSFGIKEIEPLLNKILLKTRLNSEVVILDRDFDLLSLKHYRGELDLASTNAQLFNNGGGLKSVINLEFIINILKSKDNVELLNVNVDYANCSFIIKIRRTK